MLWVAVFDLLNSDLSFEAAQWFLQVQKWSLYVTVLPGTHFSSVFCSLHKALVHFQELENLNSKRLNSHTHTHTQKPIGIRIPILGNACPFVL